MLPKEIFKIKTTYGIELNVREKEKLCVRIAGLSLAKGQLTIRDSFLEFDSLEEVNKAVKPYQHITISITGKGLLIKLISLSKDQSQTEAIKQVIPGGKINDYYCQIYRISSTQAFAAIIRRENVDNYINQIIQFGYFVDDIILGPFSVLSLYPLVLRDNPKISNQWDLDGYSLIFEYSGLINIVKPNGQITASEPVHIGNEEVPALYIIAYASASHFFLRDNQLVQADFLHLGTSRSTFKKFRLLQKVAAVMIIFIIAIALLNAMVYTYQYNLNETLKNRFLVENRKMNSHQTLKKEFDAKLLIAKELGMLHNYHKGFVLDQLALSCPPDISWTKVILSPLDEEQLKNNRVKKYRQQILQVEGTCQNPILANNWLGSLTKLPWVKDITNQSFLYDDYRKKGVLKFEIQLN